jgi:hypothetical protein
MSPGGALAMLVAAPLGLLVLRLSLQAKVVAYLAVLTLVGFVKIRLPHTSVQVLPNVIAIVALAHLAYQVLTRRLLLPIRSRLAIGVAFFAVAALLQSFNPILRAVGLSPSEGGVYLFPMLLFALGVWFFSSPANGRLLLQAVLVLAIIASAVMLEQLLFGFSSADRKYYALAGHRVLGERKLIGTYGGPDSYAFASAFFTLAALAARSCGVWPRVSLSVVVLGALGTITSGVRAGLLGLSLAVMVFLIMELADPQRRAAAVRSLAVASVLAVALGALVFASPARTRNETLTANNGLQSSVRRLALFKQGTSDADVSNRLARMGEFNSFIARHPLGAGPGIVKVRTALISGGQEGLLGSPPTGLPAYLTPTFLYQHDYEYVSMGAELGLAPLALFYLLVLAGGRDAVILRKRTDSPVLRALLALTTGTTVLVATVTLTNESFRGPQVAGIFWLMLAVPVAVRYPMVASSADVAPVRCPS